MCIRDRFSNALIAMGVKKGEPVSSLLVNSPQAVIAQLGCWKVGAVYAPLNPLYTERELEELLNTSGARVMLVLTPFYARVKAIQSKTKLEYVIPTRIREYLPFVLRPVSYTHLRAHETVLDLVCRLLLDIKNPN